MTTPLYAASLASTGVTYAVGLEESPAVSRYITLYRSEMRTASLDAKLAAEDRYLAAFAAYQGFLEKLAGRHTAPLREHVSLYDMSKRVSNHTVLAEFGPPRLVTTVRQDFMVTAGENGLGTVVYMVIPDTFESVEKQSDVVSNDEWLHLFDSAMSNGVSPYRLGELISWVSDLSDDTLNRDAWVSRLVSFQDDEPRWIRFVLDNFAGDLNRDEHGRLIVTAPPLFASVAEPIRQKTSPKIGRMSVAV